MAGKLIASNINHYTRGLNTNTAYGKRVTRPVTLKSQGVLRTMSMEPWEQREDKSLEYFPNTPMFHYLTKMLRIHGLYFDDHVMWREVQDNLKIIRGKVVRPAIGQGKRAQIRASKS